jgi:CRISPR-associated protein Cas1
MRNRLHTIEGLATERYFSQIFQLLPKALSISRRRTFKAYTGIDNTFNLAYTVLKWKAYRAIIKAKLEPYLGFLHSQAVGKPSLVCDLMESYRYLIDDFLIQYCKALKKKDFTMKNEDYSTNRKGQREYLSKPLAQDMMNKLNSFFESKIEIQRIRRGNKQSLETLINEEALLLAKYLRNERKAWSPRTSEGCL